MLIQGESCGNLIWHGLNVIYRNEAFQEQLWAKSFEFLKDHLSPETVEKYGPSEPPPSTDQVESQPEDQPQQENKSEPTTDQQESSKPDDQQESQSEESPQQQEESKPEDKPAAD